MGSGHLQGAAGALQPRSSCSQALSSPVEFWVVLVVTRAAAPSSVAGSGKPWLHSSCRGYTAESRTMSPSASPWQHGLRFAPAFPGSPSIFRPPLRCGHRARAGARVASPSSMAGSWQPRLGRGLVASMFAGRRQEKGVTGLTKWGQAGPRERVQSLGTHRGQDGAGAGGACKVPNALLLQSSSCLQLMGFFSPKKP